MIVVLATVKIDFLVIVNLHSGNHTATVWLQMFLKTIGEQSL